MFTTAGEAACTTGAKLRLISARDTGGRVSAKVRAGGMRTAMEKRAVRTAVEIRGAKLGIGELLSDQLPLYGTGCPGRQRAGSEQNVVQALLCFGGCLARRQIGQARALRARDEKPIMDQPFRLHRIGAPQAVEL